MEIQWPLAFFTVLVCAAAGLMSVIGAMIAAGKGRKVYYPSLICIAVTLVIGGCASFLHLEHWERIFNGFGNLTSGITQELISLVVSFIILVALFVLIRRAGGDALPKWIGVVMLVWGFVLVIVCGNSYMMSARPAWSNFSMLFYYLADALVLGTAYAWLLSVLCGEQEAGAKLGLLTLLGGIVAAVAVVVFSQAASNATYTGVPMFFDPVMPCETPVVGAEAVSSILFGAGAGLFWGGGLAVGALVPAIAGALSKTKVDKRILAGVALAAALVGSVCFRAVFYMLGVTIFGIF